MPRTSGILRFSTNANLLKQITKKKQTKHKGLEERKSKWGENYANQLGKHRRLAMIHIINLGSNKIINASKQPLRHESNSSFYESLNVTQAKDRETRKKKHK